MTWEVTGIVSSLSVSLATLIFGAFQMRRSVRREMVVDMESRVEKLERQVLQCETERERLIRENFDLMTELRVKKTP